MSLSFMFAVILEFPPSFYAVIAFAVVLIINPGFAMTVRAAPAAITTALRLGTLQDVVCTKSEVTRH